MADGPLAGVGVLVTRPVGQSGEHHGDLCLFRDSGGVPNQLFVKRFVDTVPRGIADRCGIPQLCDQRLICGGHHGGIDLGAAGPLITGGFGKSANQGDARCDRRVDGENVVVVFKQNHALARHLAGQCMVFIRVESGVRSF